MKLARNSIAALATAFFVLSATLPVSAQQDDGLELSLEFDQERFEQGAPVYATVRLSNSGRSEVSISPYLFPETGVILIDIMTPKGEEVRFWPLALSETGRESQPLLPGQEYARSFPIFFGADGWLFKEPGTYLVSARYAPEGKPLLQVTSSLAITGSDAGIDLYSEESGEAARFLLWLEGQHLKTGIAYLQQFTRQYSRSSAANFARFALAEALSVPSRDFAKGAVRPPDCARALPAFAQVDPEQLPSLLRIRKLVSESRCLTVLQRPEQARARLDAAREQAANRSELVVYLEHHAARISQE